MTISGTAKLNLIFKLLTICRNTTLAGQKERILALNVHIKYYCAKNQISKQTFYFYYKRVIYKRVLEEHRAIFKQCG